MSSYLSTTCGSLLATDDTTIALITSGDLQGACSLTLLSNTIPLPVFSLSDVIVPSLLPSEIIEEIQGTIDLEISPITLPSISDYAPYVSQNFIYSFDPPLPDGLALSGSTITGTPSEADTVVLRLATVEIFSKLSIPMAEYTIVISPPDTSSSTSLSTGSLTAIIVGSILGAAVLFLMVVLIRQRRINNRPFDFNVIVKSDELGVAGDERKIHREINRGYVTIQSVLGKGNFGEVSKGVVNEGNGRGDMTVAIKVLHKSADAATARGQLLEEAALMAQFDHANVVKLIGVVTQGNPLLVVMEFCSGGALDSYLQANDCPYDRLCNIALNCASGLAYLALRKFIHRDIAARNVLLDGNGVAKIADFGMSRQAVGKEYYLSSKGGHLPIRWTAPECLEDYRFSEQSDVWSFGILLHELWTKAELPYKGWRNEKVWVQVLGGYRLPCPPGCPIRIHILMLSCWNEPGDRPAFSSICQTIKMLTEAHEHGASLIVPQTAIATEQAETGHGQTDMFKSIDNSNVDLESEPKRKRSTLTYMVPDIDLAKAQQYAVIVQKPRKKSIDAAYAQGILSASQPTNSSRIAHAEGANFGFLDEQDDLIVNEKADGGYMQVNPSSVQGSNTYIDDLEPKKRPSVKDMKAVSTTS